MTITLGNMTITLGDVISWLIIGALAGWLIGITIRRRATRIDLLINLGIGLAGEILGWTLFRLLSVNLVLLEKITVNVQDIVAAFIGSLIVLAILWLAAKRVSWLRRI